MLQLIKKILKFIMPSFSNNSQQQIFRRTWHGVTKKLQGEKLGKFMVVKGRVVGRVDLKDIGKTIHYNGTATITEYEINKSKDLQEALRRNWIEIIEDRGAMLRAVSSTEEPKVAVQAGLDEARILEMAKEIAKHTALEIIKQSVSEKGGNSNGSNGNGNVNDIAKELARQMMEEIKKGTSDRVIEKEKLVLEEEKAGNVFIDVDEKGVNAKITNIGKEKEEKIDISDSLERMKKFKRKVG
jgi:hypothetical protein